MDYSVESIKKWLKGAGKDRNWLAKKLYVSKSTVDNWLAPSTPTPIPKAKLAFIQQLMEQSKTIDMWRLISGTNGKGTISAILPC